MKYLYTSILILFLTSCSLGEWNSDFIDNKSDNKKSYWEKIIPSDSVWNSTWYRNTKSWIDTSTKAS